MNLIAKSIIIAVTATTGVLTAVVPSTHATSQSTCVDGAVRSNLTVTWLSSKSVTVGTVNSKPLCEDVAVHFSSYTMPDDYNGKPFSNNATANPQTIFDNATVILKKGSTKPTALSIKLPDACKNIQVDVYHGPKIDVVGPKGHGAQYISGKILSKTQDTCTPVTPVTPSTPSIPTPEAQTPETPAPEVVLPSTPAELPKTGVAALNMTILGSILAIATYAVVFVTGKRA